MLPKTLETDRLRIRPLTMDDLDPLYDAIYGDSEVSRYFTNASTYDDAYRVHVSKVHQNQAPDNCGFGYWTIVHRISGNLAGLLNLGPPGPVTWAEIVPSSRAYPLRDEVELGYALIRAYWGHGYASEACRSVAAYAFGELDLSRIVNNVHRANDRSINLMYRLGFVLEDNLRDPNYRVGILTREVFLSAAT